MDKKRRQINNFNNKKKLCNGKLIKNLLLTMTIVDSKQSILIGKPVIYIRAIVELYNWRNDGQVDKIYGIIELEKMRNLTAKSIYHYGAH